MKKFKKHISGMLAFVILFTNCFVSYGAFAKGSEDVLVIKNNQGVLQAQACEWTGFEKDEPDNCRTLKTISPESIKLFAGALHEKPDLCKSTFFGTNEAFFANRELYLLLVSSVSLGFAANIPLIDVISAASRGEQLAVMLSVLAAFVIPALVIAPRYIDGLECADMYQWIAGRLYEKTVEKVPDGYMQIKKIPDGLRSILLK